MKMWKTFVFSFCVCNFSTFCCFYCFDVRANEVFLCAASANNEMSFFCEQCIVYTCNAGRFYACCMFLATCKKLSSPLLFNKFDLILI